MKNTAYEAVMTQVARLIAEATVATLTAEQDASHSLTARQRVALKALTRQLHLAQTAQIHAEQAGDPPAEPHFAPARRPLSIKVVGR